MCVVIGLGHGVDTDYYLHNVLKNETKAIIDLLTFSWILCSVSIISQV